MIDELAHAGPEHLERRLYGAYTCVKTAGGAG